MIIKGNCQIAGIGIYLPEQIVTSKELMREIKSEANYGISESWLDDVVGISNRRVARRDEKPSHLAIKAAEEALKNSGITASEIDVVIFCGISREWIEPAVAHKVQHELGCTNAICFDVSNACHGFMNSILIANNLMQASDAKYVLVVTGEVSTDITFHYVDKLKVKDASLKKEIGALTLGDAGAAMVLQPREGESGFQLFNFATNAKHTNLCKISVAGTGGYEGQMLMSQISSEIVQIHSNLIQSTYSALDWKPEDIELFVCHQVGEKPHLRMSKMAGVPASIAPISYKDYGNITTATIPFNLYQANPKKGQKALIGGTGSGLTISQSGIIF
ncbi:ketoacyl-ACP synthase III [Marinomonas balearica]|uniref:3-oxoacyl-[acyl-carrier-protein] synthase-3 n=1 Tax=Marinomonas balearica TaxID=491947 RepID=A0A4R6M7Y4_9GAMM|nr:ketoacyl-ACP synthase III [Marinomonas balearica]TDO97276.1 3-oxoacyl-[acyl-carrier-protein] synthase-3 [Marinomonas balearica]